MRCGVGIIIINSASATAVTGRSPPFRALKAQRRTGCTLYVRSLFSSGRAIAESIYNTCCPQSAVYVPGAGPEAGRLRGLQTARRRNGREARSPPASAPDRHSSTRSQRRLLPGGNPKMPSYASPFPDIEVPEVDLWTFLFERKSRPFTDSKGLSFYPPSHHGTLSPHLGTSSWPASGGWVAWRERASTKPSGMERERESQH